MSIASEKTSALIAACKVQADEIDVQVTRLIAENKIMRAALWEIATTSACSNSEPDIMGAALDNLVATAQGALHRANDV
jgi:hypothetical protein